MLCFRSRIMLWTIRECTCRDTVANMYFTVPLVHYRWVFYITGHSCPPELHGCWTVRESSTASPAVAAAAAAVAVPFWVLRPAITAPKVRARWTVSVVAPHRPDPDTIRNISYRTNTISNTAAAVPRSMRIAIRCTVPMTAVFSFSTSWHAIRCCRMCSLSRNNCSSCAVFCNRWVMCWHMFNDFVSACNVLCFVLIFGIRKLTGHSLFVDVFSFIMFPFRFSFHNHFKYPCVHEILCINVNCCDSCAVSMWPQPDEEYLTRVRLVLFCIFFAHRQ